GARLVKDINPSVWGTWTGTGDALPAGSNIHDMVAAGNRVFFVADDGQHGEELWVSNGTALGTYLVKDINTTDPTLLPSGDLELNAGAGVDLLAVMGNRVFFVADDGVHGRELWVSDGTAAGTKMVLNINA